MLQPFIEIVDESQFGCHEGYDEQDEGGAHVDAPAWQILPFDGSI
tara:strand:+ start:59 stop:193 length:135 start_codon:yes stop_codon:yes gene_type:complete